MSLTHESDEERSLRGLAPLHKVSPTPGIAFARAHWWAWPIVVIALVVGWAACVTLAFGVIIGVPWALATYVNGTVATLVIGAFFGGAFVKSVDEARAESERRRK